MKKTVVWIIYLLCICMLLGCEADRAQPQIAATTLPVYEFTSRLCAGTQLTVGRVITQSVSCLHDYSLQTGQMRMLEGAELVVISGAGLEDFLDLDPSATIADASKGIELLCPGEEHHHEHSGHSHESDPHIWLSPENAKRMCGSICQSLCELYPESSSVFQENLQQLIAELDALQLYGEETLSALGCRELITFHDGFGYFAEAFDLTILEAVEEESGSEASAHELIGLIELVREHQLPAVFTERSGSASAADIIAAETGALVYTLDMGMGEYDYFETMYHNINTIKEALG